MLAAGSSSLLSRRNLQVRAPGRNHRDSLIQKIYKDSPPPPLPIPYQTTNLSLAQYNNLLAVLIFLYNHFYHFLILKSNFLSLRFFPTPQTKMQFSTIFSVTALIAAVAAAPAPAPACEATATQTSTINCANTPGYAYETCVIGNHATIWENCRYL